DVCSSDLAREARQMASYLRGLGLPAGANVGLISKNCAEWILADLAILMAGYVSVPLYPTLTGPSVRQILEHSGAAFLFVGKLENWEEIRTGVPEGLPQLAFSLAPEAARKAMPVWTDVLSGQVPLENVHQPAADEIATIIYTSGTTGMPKGVMQSYGNLANIGGRMDRTYPIGAGDRVISYLPLSHVAERAAIEMSMCYVGLKDYF